MNIYEGITSDGYQARVMAESFEEAIVLAGGNSAKIDFVEKIPQLIFVPDSSYNENMRG